MHYWRKRYWGRKRDRVYKNAIPVHKWVISSSAVFKRFRWKHFSFLTNICTHWMTMLQLVLVVLIPLWYVIFVTNYSVDLIYVFITHILRMQTSCLNNKITNWYTVSNSFIFFFKLSSMFEHGSYESKWPNRLEPDRKKFEKYDLLISPTDCR